MFWLALIAPLLASEDQLEQVEQQTATADQQQRTENADPAACETEFATECLIRGIVGSSQDRCSPACQVYYSQLSYECYENYNENFQWKAMQQACDPQGLKTWTPPDDGGVGDEEDGEGKTREDLDSVDATESFADAPTLISFLALLFS